MAATIPFTKMHGAGNDYVYINGFVQRLDDIPALARSMSDRHFGIGSDGIVLVLPSQVADIRMRMFNADGTEAEMCGNASRCVAKYAYDHSLVKKERFTLETGCGIKTVQLLFRDGKVTGATVDMGEPVLEAGKVPVEFAGMSEQLVNRPIMAGDQEFFFTAVSMGNPHAVIFMPEIDDLDLSKIGPLFENHHYFPKRTNTEFAQVRDNSHIRMRVWERGAGETLACGTGACATLVASALNGHTGREADIELRGGTLRVKWDAENNHLYMTGPAVTVFDGEYYAGQSNEA